MKNKKIEGKIKNKLNRLFVITIVVVVAIAMGCGVSYAWITLREVSGLTVSVDQYVPNLLVGTSATNLSESFSIGKEITLNPCTFDNGRCLDKNGDECESAYCLTIYIKPAEKMDVTMTFNCSGDLPVRCAVYTGVYEILENGDSITFYEMPANQASMKIMYIYVDGEECQTGGSANISISFS